MNIFLIRFYNKLCVYSMVHHSHRIWIFFSLEGKEKHKNNPKVMQFVTCCEWTLCDCVSPAVAEGNLCIKSDQLGKLAMKFG